MKKLVIIGAGDFGREIANVVERINAAADEKEWDLTGFIDDDPGKQGMTVDGYRILGTIEDLNAYSETVYAICSFGVARIRENVIRKITNPKVKYATLIDPDARTYRDVQIGEGTIICGGTILAINAHVGSHVIINLNCTLGHDVIVDDYCVINPGVNISGKVVVHRSSDLGTGAKVIQGLEIGPDTTVGAGAVVVRSVPACCTAVGAPAKPIKYHTV